MSFSAFITDTNPYSSDRKYEVRTTSNPAVVRGRFDNLLAATRYIDKAGFELVYVNAVVLSVDNVGDQDAEIEMVERDIKETENDSWLSESERWERLLWLAKYRRILIEELTAYQYLRNLFTQPQEVN